MLEFLSNIANAIFTVFQLLLNMVRGLVSFFLMIPHRSIYGDSEMCNCYGNDDCRQSVLAFHCHFPVRWWRYRHYGAYPVPQLT